LPGGEPCQRHPVLQQPCCCCTPPRGLAGYRWPGSDPDQALLASDDIQDEHVTAPRRRTGVAQIVTKKNTNQPKARLASTNSMIKKMSCKAYHHTQHRAHRTPKSPLLRINQIVEGYDVQAIHKAERSANNEYELRAQEDGQQRKVSHTTPRTPHTIDS
jgi:hypothetical protein